MRFMMLMIPKDYEKAPADAQPPAEAVAAMMKYNQALKDAGVLVSLDGLYPPAKGARVAFAGGKTSVARGPFGTSEALGGYWMIQVKSQDEAIEWAKRCPVMHDAVIEIRQVQEMEDFPTDVQKTAAGFKDMQSRRGA
ncbi:MAG: YciI family protein [Stellaceae bacterium]